MGDVAPPWTLVASGDDQLQAFADRMLLSSAAADKAVGNQVRVAAACGPSAGTHSHQTAMPVPFSPLQRKCPQAAGRSTSHSCGSQSC